MACLLREKFSKTVVVGFVNPDDIEEKNTYRQNFCKAEVGCNKAVAVLRNIHKSAHRRLSFGSCFNEHCLKPGLARSPQA